MLTAVHTAGNLICGHHSFYFKCFPSFLYKLSFFPSSSLVNLILFIALIPAVIYASMRPLLCHKYAHFLETYQLLPTVGVLPTPDGQWDDLSLYLLFLGENISELKSFKYIKVRSRNS